MKLYPTIGLEIHAELTTNSKVFCTCSAQFGGEPNSRCCPVCSGLPGTLPVLNAKAVEYIIKAGYIMNCDISRFTKWDRKNYFYPDLPKAYQISQMPRPVCLGGHVDVEVDGETRTMRINRIHLEEDAGKLVHDDSMRVSLADYNRCGIPLIEIVTEPDFHSAAEVVAFFEKIRLMLQYAGVCDGRLEQGSMRCDVNISLAEKNFDTLGTRTEVKNLNSLRSIQRAIEYEIYRQTELIENGERVVQETLHFNDATGETSSLRSKEDAHDYRYFPDPDIPPIIFTEEELAAIKADIPEMPEMRVKRYTEQYGISAADAKILTDTKSISDFFESAVKAYNAPKAIGTFIVVELMRRINLGEISAEDMTLDPADFAHLIELAETGKISKDSRKIILRDMIDGKTAERSAEDNNLWIKEDNELLEKTIDEIMAANPKAVEQYRNGETKVFGFLMGQCGKALKGAAAPASIKTMLEQKLKQ